MAYFTPWDAALCASALLYCTNCSLFLLEKFFKQLNFELYFKNGWILIGLLLILCCLLAGSVLINWILCILFTDIHKKEFVCVKQFQEWNTSTKMCIFFFFNEYALNNKSAIQISEFWMQWAWDDTLRESSLKIHLHDIQRASHILLLPQVQTNW